MTYPTDPSALSLVTAGWRWMIDGLYRLHPYFVEEGAVAEDTPPALYTHIHRQLSVAEAMLRRLLAVLAGAMSSAAIAALAEAATRSGTAGTAQKQTAGTRGPRAPHFSLLDPMDPPPAGEAPKRNAPPPRFWVPGMETPFPPLPDKRPPPPRTAVDEDAWRDLAPLIDRANAMAAVINDPGRHVRRMALWLHRRGALIRAADTGGRARPARQHPIRSIAPPPYATPKRLRQHHDMFTRLSVHAHTAIRRAYFNSS